MLGKSDESNGSIEESSRKASVKCYGKKIKSVS